MTAFCGMDTISARAAAAAIDAGAHRLEALTTQLADATASVRWEGSDAAALRDRWRGSVAPALARSTVLLSLRGVALRSEADEQDAVSAADQPVVCAAPRPSALPLVVPEQMDRGYLEEDLAWLPAGIEDPLEGVASSTALWASHQAAGLWDRGIDGLEAAGRAPGLDVEGLEQLRRDGHSLGGSITDLASGRRVPAVAELLSGGLLVGASGVLAGVEALPGPDATILDDRTAVAVTRVTRTGPAASAEDLAGLLLEEDETRRELLGRSGASAFDPRAATQIRIQEVRGSDGCAPVFIVHIPPTQGGLTSRDAWGAQGNPLGWDQNPRLVAGQDTASLAAVRTAMEAAGVPRGSRVLLVGHSQGGIIAAHLAADPTFSATTGAPGTYDVTHVLAVGSPVQTVVPALATTQVVSVSHGPVALGPWTSTGDLVPALDLDGTQVLGGRIGSPGTHEVVLPGRRGATLDHGRIPFMEANHESVPRDEHGAILPGGYRGSLLRAQGTDPTLAGLQRDLQGVYIGEGTAVTGETLVEVSREDLR